MLAGVVRDLDHLLPRVLGAHAAAGKLHDDVGGLVAFDARVTGDVGADSGAHLDAAAEVVGNVLVAGEGECVTEDDDLGCRVDAELFQTGDDGVAHNALVSRILAEAVEQLCLLHGEGAKEGAGGEGVYEGGAKGAVVYGDPVFQRKVIGPLVAEHAAVEHHPFVREGADGGKPVLHGEVYVGRAGTHLAALF